MLIMVALFGGLLACGSTPSERAPRDDEAPQEARARKASGPTAASARGEARPKASARASAPAVRASAASAAKASGGSRARRASGAAGQEPLGAMGDVTGRLVLTPGAGTDGTLTALSLSLESTAGAQTVPLGDAPGTCAESAEQPKSDGALKHLWTVSCTSDQGGGVLSVAQANASLVVRRARTAPDGTRGPFKLSKRIPLVEGATVVKP
jgi:hypothetical protein